jgi:hypothetical protein
MRAENLRLRCFSVATVGCTALALYVLEKNGKGVPCVRDTVPFSYGSLRKGKGAAQIA